MLKKFFTWEFIRFAMTGVFNTVLSWCITNFLFVKFPALNFFISFAIGYLIPMFISYFLNCYFTFRTKPSWLSLLKFPLSYIPNFCIQALFLWLGVMLLHYPKSLVLLGAQILAFPVTFIVMKMVVFLKGKPEEPKGE